MSAADADKGEIGMSIQLLDELRGFLRDLESTQDSLLQLFGRKLSALHNSQADELMQLSTQEAELARQLQILLGRRQRILEQVRQDGYSCETLFAVVDVLGGDDRDQLQSRIRRAEQMSQELRQESWVHWIISNRAYNHYTEILELIAHCGEKSPTYSQQPNEGTSGGAILDTSV